jgi:hypothetical protein
MARRAPDRLAGMHRIARRSPGESRHEAKAAMRRHQSPNDHLATVAHTRQDFGRATSVGTARGVLTGISEMDRVPPAWRRPLRRPSRRSAGSQFVHPGRQRDGRPSDGAGGLCDPGASRLVTLTVPFSDTAAASSSLGIAPAPCAVLQITSGATRVARYARESDERGSPSRSSPPAGARSTAHAGSIARRS